MGTKQFNYLSDGFGISFHISLFSSKTKSRMRRIILFAFFLFQILGIVYSRFLDERYFCWAPFDQISYYEVKTEVNGVLLSPQQTRGRYNLQGYGRENRSIHNVFSIIKQYENSYGKNEKAVVKVIYSTNGKAKEEWDFSTE